MAEQRLNLSIKVNAETGQLEVMGAKLSDIAGKAKQTGGSFSGLTTEAKGLASGLLPFATGAGLVAFFTAAVKGAEEENESLRRLQFTLEANGVAWAQNKQEIINWATAIQSSTRFADGETLKTLDKLTRATGNLKQAQSATILAQNLSVASGKDLASTTQLVNDLILKQSRGVSMATKEFGSFTEGATTAQGILDALSRTTEDAAAEEESLTKSTAQLKNVWGDFTDQIGNAAAPALISIITFLKNKVVWIDKVITGITTLAAVWFTAVTGMAKVWKSAFTLDWDGVKEAVRGAMAGIEAITLESAEKIREMEQESAAKTVEVQRQKVQTVVDLSAEELRAKEEQQRRFEQMDLELDQKIAALGDQTYQKKLASFNAEINARKAKINREITDEVQKLKLLAKLDQLREDQIAKLAKIEAELKREMAFQTMETAVQTLSVLNSLSESGTKSEINRAKAILALEKSIAIARILSSPESVMNPALKAASIALTVAQFAQQHQAIDRAASAFQSGQRSISVDTPIGGGRTIEETFGGGGGGGTFPVGGGSSVGFSSGGGGGGGGGGTVINNTINVAIDIDKLSVENTRQIMLGITESVRQGVTEGVQLANALRNSADRNGSLAV